MTSSILAVDLYGNIWCACDDGAFLMGNDICTDDMTITGECKSISFQQSTNKGLVSGDGFDYVFDPISPEEFKYLPKLEDQLCTVWHSSIPEAVIRADKQGRIIIYDTAENRILLSKAVGNITRCVPGPSKDCHQSLGLLTLGEDNKVQLIYPFVHEEFTLTDSQNQTPAVATLAGIQGTILDLIWTTQGVFVSTEKEITVYQFQQFPHPDQLKNVVFLEKFSSFPIDNILWFSQTDALFASDATSTWRISPYGAIKVGEYLIGYTQSLTMSRCRNQISIQSGDNTSIDPSHISELRLNSQIDNTKELEEKGFALQTREGNIILKARKLNSRVSKYQEILHSVKDLKDEIASLKEIFTSLSHQKS